MLSHRTRALIVASALLTGLAVGLHGAPAPPAAAAATSSVAIANFAFVSDPITISAGDTVTWTNDDSAVHDVMSTNGDWGSGVMATGVSFSHTFTDAGTYTYLCSLHPYMTGTVVVSP